MLENQMKAWLKPIHNAIEKLVPTNRSLIDFINEKAMGNGIKRSIYKIKFIDKSEKSTYSCISMTLNELKKNLQERKVKEEDANIIIEKATEILNDAHEQVAKVYGEVRRYVVTSELRTGCVQNHYKKIPSMSNAQNEAISKEIFSMAVEFVNKSENHDIGDVEEEFERINKIAITLFNLVEATNTQKKPDKHVKARHAAVEKSSYNPLNILENLW